MKRTCSTTAALLGLALSPAVFAADAAVEKVTVRSVAHFDFDKASLRPEEQATLLAEVSKMKGVTWQNVVATGHTDSVGDPAYNGRLSTRRADAVKAYLVSNGLSADMVGTQARAATAPVASNGTDQGRARNRRTEIEFQGVRSTPP